MVLLQPLVLVLPLILPLILPLVLCLVLSIRIVPLLLLSVSPIATARITRCLKPFGLLLLCWWLLWCWLLLCRLLWWLLLCWWLLSSLHTWLLWHLLPHGLLRQERRTPLLLHPSSCSSCSSSCLTPTATPTHAPTRLLPLTLSTLSTPTGPSLRCHRIQRLDRSGATTASRRSPVTARLYDTPKDTLCDEYQALSGLNEQKQYQEDLARNSETNFTSSMVFFACPRRT